MKEKNRHTNAFTLIELLTVIAIIGVLVALLFPAIKAALLRAEVGKSQTHIAGLQTAFKSYYTEYGRWPATEDLTLTPPPVQTIYVSSKLIGLLKGEDVGGLVAGSSGVDDNPGAVTYNGNPRRIVFLEFKAADFTIKGGTITNFVDPWKKVYYCRFDSDYNNQVSNPFLPYSLTANFVNNGFLIWSHGPDNQDDPNCGDPPGPYTANPCVNKDNVKSW